MGTATFQNRSNAELRSFPPFNRLGKVKAFTLVEVVISLGIFSFAFLSIAGLMATGLSAVKNSSSSQAITNINRSLRSSLQAMSYTNLVVGASTTYYFTADGYLTTSSSATPSAPFYKAVLTPATPTKSVYPPIAGTVPNACSISAIISYPSPVYKMSVTNSYFVAQ